MRNFTDIKPLMADREAVIEASRCLYCYNAPCIQACPTTIDVPEFIRRIATGNIKGSARIILDANVLGNSCGKVCPTEVLCEGACVYNNNNNKPIEIGRLQRYATDYVLKHNIQILAPGKTTGKNIAVIGSGPAGISCAVELRKLGHEVTIYDSNNFIGGMNRYGIALYKLSVADFEEELQYIKRVGINFVLGKQVGNIELLKFEQTYDAVFLGVGLGNGKKLGIPGEDLPEVHEAIGFIRGLHEGNLESIKTGKRVVVIGAGNTAIDAATQVKRLGAEEVYIIYRRGEGDKSCHPYEYELAKKDGVIFKWYSLPVKILGDKNVIGIECVKTKPASPDLKEKTEPKLIQGSEWVLNVDMVVNALGQEKRESWLSNISGLQLKKGSVVADPETGQTGNKKYFAGGDCVNGGKEVVNAVAEGKKAAMGIHQFVMGEIN